MGKYEENIQTLCKSNVDLHGSMNCKVLWFEKAYNDKGEMR